MPPSSKVSMAMQMTNLRHDALPSWRFCSGINLEGYARLCAAFGILHKFTSCHELLRGCEAVLISYRGPCSSAHKSTMAARPWAPTRCAQNLDGRNSLMHCVRFRTPLFANGHSIAQQETHKRLGCQCFRQFLGLA